MNENCCLCICFTELYVFCWLLVVSLVILIAVPFVFSRSVDIACRSTQNASRIKRFWRWHIDKTIKWKKYIITSLLCSSVTLLMFIQTLDHISRCGGNFFNGLAKSPRMFRSSWILNEYNLYCKIVKYCILSQFCMIKTVPHVLFHLRCDV